MLTKEENTMLTKEAVKKFREWQESLYIFLTGCQGAIESVTTDYENNELYQGITMAIKMIEEDIKITEESLKIGNTTIRGEMICWELGCFWNRLLNVCRVSSTTSPKHLIKCFKYYERKMKELFD